MNFKKRVLTSEAQKKENSKIVVAGWVSNIKIMGSLAFITLRDNSGTLQLTFLKKQFKEFNKLKEITKESSIAAKGTIKKGKLKSGEKELIVDELKVLNLSKPVLPIEIGKGTTGLDKRLDHRFLDMRDPKVASIFKVRSQIFLAATNYLDSQGFTNLCTPKLTTMGVESGAELFKVQYFKQRAYLSQSPQIYKQMGVASGLERVYEIAPVFRAEKSHTTRHVTEFFGVDFEMGFINDEHDVMDVIEGLFKHIIQHVQKNCQEELETYKIKLETPKEIPRITMKEAKEILAKLGKKLTEYDDLDAEAESKLGDYIKKKFKSDFVFVTNYPWVVRPFYHMKPNEDPAGTKSFDLLWNGVEIATGAQREHRYDVLKAQAEEKGINLNDMKSYVEIFRMGIPPHGGVGLGLDRMTQRLLKLENTREAIFLPRDPERLTP